MLAQEPEPCDLPGSRDNYLECMDNFLDNPAGRPSFCLDEDRCNIYCTTPPPEGAGTDDCGNPDRNAVPVDCVGDWSDWSECTLPCVGEDGLVGEQTHTYEHNPTNVFGGLPCSIADGVVQTQACNPQVRTHRSPVQGSHQSDSRDRAALPDPLRGLVRRLDHVRSGPVQRGHPEPHLHRHHREGLRR